MNILLSMNKGFTWKTIRDEQGIVYYKGPESLDGLVSKIASLDNTELVECISRLPLPFAIIIDKGDKVYAVTDIARSIPLFFDSNSEYLSDKADTIRIKRNIMQSDVDLLLYDELLSKRCTSAGCTVFADIKQLMAGEIKVFSCNSVETIRYYQHIRKPVQRDEIALKTELKIVAYKMIRDLNVPKSSRIVLPLSGGYDSRLIACLLKEEGFDNVICYTYGREMDYEVQNSKKVAEKLQYDWHFVKYDKAKWTRFFSSNDVEEYFEETHNHCNLPHVQEYIALQELFEKEVLFPGDIVIPGFCGDFPAGSFSNVPLYSNYNYDSLIEYIFSQQFLNVKFSKETRTKLKRKLILFFEENNLTVINRSDFINAYEYWTIQSRLVMWVVNSVRVYEHFNLEWRLPMWNKDYLNFWYSVPDDFRKDCSLYRNWLFEELFKKYDVCLKKPGASKTHNSPIKSGVANVVKRILIFVSCWTGTDYYKRNNLNDYNDASLILFKKLLTKRHYRYHSLSIHLMEEIWWCQTKYSKRVYLEAFK